MAQEGKYDFDGDDRNQSIVVLEAYEEKRDFDGNYRN
jgi:hypothetical protein